MSHSIASRSDVTHGHFHCTRDNLGSYASCLNAIRGCQESPSFLHREHDCLQRSKRSRINCFDTNPVDDKASAAALASFTILDGAKGINRHVERFALYDVES